MKSLDFRVQFLDSRVVSLELLPTFLDGFLLIIGRVEGSCDLVIDYGDLFLYLCDRLLEHLI
jgi:hypothetical protein